MDLTNLASLAQSSVSLATAEPTVNVVNPDNAAFALCEALAFVTELALISESVRSLPLNARDELTKSLRSETRRVIRGDTGSDDSEESEFSADAEKFFRDANPGETWILGIDDADALTVWSVLERSKGKRGTPPVLTLQNKRGEMLSVSKAENLARVMTAERKGARVVSAK